PSRLDIELGGLVLNKFKMYINGEWTDNGTNGRSIDEKNSSNREGMASIPRGTEGHVDEAVKAAYKAFRSEQWKKVKPHERGELLFSIADKMKAERDELAKLESMDVGKPLSQGYADVDAAI